MTAILFRETTEDDIHRTEYMPGFTLLFLHHCPNEQPEGEAGVRQIGAGGWTLGMVLDVWDKYQQWASGGGGKKASWEFLKVFPHGIIQIITEYDDSLLELES